MKVYDTGYKHNNKTSEVGPETDRLQPSPSKLQKKKKTDHVPNSIDTFNKAQSNPTPVMVPEVIHFIFSKDLSLCAIDLNNLSYVISLMFYVIDGQSAACMP